eukprot:2474126-Pleurochrysis_carterae.AAC.2
MRNVHQLFLVPGGFATASAWKALERSSAKQSALHARAAHTTNRTPLRATQLMHWMTRSVFKVFDQTHDARVSSSAPHGFWG